MYSNSSSEQFTKARELSKKRNAGRAAMPILGDDKIVIRSREYRNVLQDLVIMFTTIFRVLQQRSPVITVHDRFLNRQ